MNLATIFFVAAQVGGIHVYDGDTFRMNGVSYRLAGIDAPEIGHRAKCPREQLLAHKARNSLRRMMAKPYTLEEGKKEKYGRTLVVVRLADGTTANEKLVDAKLATIYTGRGTRPNWCGTPE
jgi:endonuclease YncB( thermonuclease family)